MYFKYILTLYWQVSTYKYFIKARRELNHLFHFSPHYDLHDMCWSGKIILFFFPHSFFVIEICTWNLFLGICSEMLLILLLLWTREGNKTSELLSREAWRGTRSKNTTSTMPFSILLLQLTYISTHITNLPCDFICPLNSWAILFDCKGSFKQRVLNMH